MGRDGEHESMQTHNVLILTSTIKVPPGVPSLVRIDRNLRIDDYCRSLEFYCRMPEEAISKIVFADNSEADLSPLRKIAFDAGSAHRVEFISFNGLDHPSAYGRGYGEFKALDYVMANARSLQEQDRRSVIWKGTGRYRILNLTTLIQTAPASFDLYCDTRQHPMSWVDLRVFACTVSGYQKLLQDRYKQYPFREDLHHTPPEHLLYPVIKELAAHHSIVTRFRREPLVDGIRGFDGRNYSKGVNLLKYWIRASGKRLNIPI